MKTIVASILAFGAMTAAAAAAEPGKKPMQLTDVQMDSVTAGQLVVIRNVDVGLAVAVPVNAAANVCAIATCIQRADAEQQGFRIIGLRD